MEIKQKQIAIKSGSQGSSGEGSFQKRTQTIGVRENTSAAINKIGKVLNKTTEKLLNWSDENLLQLSFNLYSSCANYAKYWTKLDIDVNESQKLLFHSLSFMEKFNDYIFMLEDSNYDGQISIRDVDWTSGVQIALSQSWDGLVKLETKYLELDSVDGVGNILSKIKGQKERIFSDFDRITAVVSSYRDEAIIQANLLMKSIFDYKQFGDRNWKEIDKDSVKKMKINDSEKWLRIFMNLDTQNPQASIDLVEKYAIIRANLAIIHDDEDRRIEHLGVADELLNNLPGYMQHRVRNFLKRTNKLVFISKKNCLHSQQDLVQYQLELQFV